MRVAGVIKSGAVADDCLTVVKHNYWLQYGNAGLIIVVRHGELQVRSMALGQDLCCDEQIEPGTHVIVLAIRTFTPDIVVNQVIPEQFYLQSRTDELLEYRQRLLQAWTIVLVDRLRRANSLGLTLQELQSTFTRVERLLSGAEMADQATLAGLPPVKAAAKAIMHWLTSPQNGCVKIHGVTWHDQCNAFVAIEERKLSLGQSQRLDFSNFRVVMDVVP